METLLKLNLVSPAKAEETATLPETEKEESKPLVVGKRLNQLANKAAHKAAKDFATTRSNLFSK